MKYADARARIKSGDVVAFTHRKLSTFYDFQVWMVRWATASKYCHVGLAFEYGGRLWLLEAVTPTVRMVPLSHFAAEGFDVVSLNAPMSDREVRAALAEVGVSAYSKWQAVLAFFGRLKLGADNLTQCCEYVITKRRKSGVVLGDKAVPSAVVEAALDLPGAHLFSVKGA